MDKDKKGLPATFPSGKPFILTIPDFVPDLNWY